MTRRPALPPSLAAALGHSRPASRPSRGRRTAEADPLLITDETFLSIDVSSTATGWAAFLPDGPGRSVAFGLIRPPAAHSAERRIDRTIVELDAVLARHRPACVVMEFTTGEFVKAARKPRGLAVMGQAQGAVRQALIDRGFSVVTVSEREWTGKRAKEKRAAEVAMIFPAYGVMRAMGGDPGMDIADSLGIGLWYLGRVKVEALARAAKGG